MPDAPRRTDAPHRTDDAAAHAPAPSSAALRDDPRPLRADARRNRRRLVDAAAAVFLEQGAEAPLELVARAADVGIGTLYRHFPGRPELLAAVLDDVVGDVIDEVRAARDDAPTAWDALVRATGWSPSLRVLLHLSRSVDGAATATGGPLRPQVDAALGIVGEIVVAAQAEGAVRSDVSAGDVLLLAAATSRALPLDGEAAENAYRRANALVLAALRPAGAEPLPGTPVELTDVPV